MPKIYTRQQKEHALYLIKELGNISEVSRRLDIPARTLRDWRLYARRQGLIPRQDPAAAYHNPSAKISARNLRDHLLAQIAALLQQQEHAAASTAYYNALAIDHHLQQLTRLNHAIDPAAPPETKNPPQSADNP